jgi:hypothetical protein
MYHEHMNILRWIVYTVIAAESVISPVPDTLIAIPKPIALATKPIVGFGNLSLATHTAVLSAQTTNPPQSSPSAIATKPAYKKSFTISLLGDSMIDTLGPDGGGLVAKLRVLYPGSEFIIRNHGVGAENIDSGIYRLTHSYTNLGIDRPSVVSEKPDIIVVESFGYNPFSQVIGALDRHWLALAEIVRTIHEQLPNTKIVIAVTIAPNQTVFGDGAPGIHYSIYEKKQKVKTIHEYLESSLAFAKGEHIPFADAYTSSRESNGDGKIELINNGDHIHYSPEGRDFFAQTVANAIATNKLLE